MEDNVESRVYDLINQVYNKRPPDTDVNEKSLSKLEDIFQFFVELSINEENIVYEGNETYLYLSVGERQSAGYPLTICYEIFEFDSEILMTENFCYLLQNCMDACTIRAAENSDNIVMEIRLDNVYLIKRAPRK